jgi:hypothetical protein
VTAIGSARQKKIKKSKNQKRRLAPGRWLVDLGRQVEEEVAAPSHLVFRHAPVHWCSHGNPTLFSRMLGTRQPVVGRCVCIEEWLSEDFETVIAALIAAAS